MSETTAPQALRPANEGELLDLVSSAASDRLTLEIISGGSKRALGQPMQARHVLDLSGLGGAIEHDPTELVLTAPASMKITDITELLSSARQHLAFEPPDLGPLLGAPAGEATLGGIIASNLAGPRRLTAGAARDHILGCHAISGRAEQFRAGGKVVKNVTGYDLCKLLAGSFGTLALFTSITVRALPQPERVATLVLQGLSDRDAMTAFATALGGPYEVSGAAHLPADLAASIRVLGAGAATLLRLEGVAISVADRAVALTSAFGAQFPVRTLDDADSAAAWQGIRDVQPFVGGGDIVWRLSVPPAEGARVLERLRARAGPVRAYLDWGGGLIWLALSSPMEEHVRAAFASCGGHATLVRAPRDMRAAIDVFQPQPAALRALGVRVKQQFDPRNILNPGRMLREAGA